MKRVTTLNPTLLAELAVRLAPHPETIATEGLAFVLRQSAAARNALAAFLGEDSPTLLPEIRHFTTEVVGDDDARTDLEGHDSHGRPVVIIENKFWAGLTPQQPVTYLKRLPREGGVLCVVAPGARLAVLWPELTQRAADSGTRKVQTLPAENRRYRARIDEIYGLTLCSWSLVLERLASALEAAGEPNVLADLRQIQGLAARMDTEGFVPLTVEDITNNTAARLLQYGKIVDVAVNKLLRLPYINKDKLMKASTAEYFGHYLCIHGLLSFLGVDFRQWRRCGISPVWLWIKEQTPKGAWVFSSETDRALAAQFGRDAVLGSPDDADPATWMAVRLPEGREEDGVVDDVVRQVLGIAEVLGKCRQSQNAAAGKPDG